MTVQEDTQFEESRLATVSAEAGGGWSITREDGWSFWVPKESPVIPAVGMTARFYGRGIGFTVRGLTLDGQVVFYRTPADEEAKQAAEAVKRDQEKRYDFEKNRADYDRRYRLLPECFQRRIDRFREGCPTFRWDYEPYELFCCEQAVAIRNVAIVQAGPVEWLKQWKEKPFDQQKAEVPALSDGHSGNTFGCAVGLAWRYIVDESKVAQAHGALTPLVGCEAYGCTHAEVKR